jgi:probable F420-dependent oxidoreductase
VKSLGTTYTRPYSKVVSYLDELDRIEPTVPPPRRALAALGPRMLRLAAERTAAAHPYFVPVSHTEQARSILGSGPRLAPEQAVVLETDPRRAREIARQHTQFYLRLSDYTTNLLRLGFDESDLVGGGSDRLVDAVVAWGGEDVIAERVREHLDAGADHVCLQVLTDSGVPVPTEYFARIAAATVH